MTLKAQLIDPCSKKRTLFDPYSNCLRTTLSGPGQSQRPNINDKVALKPSAVSLGGKGERSFLKYECLSQLFHTKSCESCSGLGGGVILPPDSLQSKFPVGLRALGREQGRVAGLLLPLSCLESQHPLSPATAQRRFSFCFLKSWWKEKTNLRENQDVKVD